MQSSGYNPSLVRTELDELIMSEYDRGSEPQEVLATDSLFFKQKSATKQAIIMEEWSGAGGFTEHAESEGIEEATIRSGNQKVFTVKKYSRGVKIPVEFYEDDQFDTRNDMVRSLGQNAALSRDKFAFAQTYGDPFSGVKTPDGVVLISNSHINMNGDTIDNLETAALSPTSLEADIRVLRLQKKQDGELGGQNAAGLMVPPALWKKAMEYTESELIPDKTDNNINVISRIYPNLKVGSSAYLDSAYNSANSNTDTTFFLISRNHHIVRWERIPLTTNLIPPSSRDDDEWYYKARFREICGAEGWEGIMGSSGTT